MFVLNPGRGRHEIYWNDDDWRNRNRASKDQWRQQRHEWKHQWKQDWKRKWRQHRYGWRSGSDIPTGSGGAASGSTEPADPVNPGGGGASGSAGAGGTSDFASGSSAGYTSEDFVDTTTFFGGIHKRIVSKNFKGGDVVTIMGGTELNLTQADFTGTVKLEVVQIFGATKIIVPASWEIRSEVTAIFAGFEDKRQQPTPHNPDKILILHGTSLFGGIELRNY
ncbi:MAG TPA: LiaF domain-containing protein [Puia sp.]|nr:LiaF domain-containing protein [Puia sp.]